MKQFVPFLLTHSILRKKRKLDNFLNRKRFLYYFCKSSLEFLIPFISVTCLYLMFALVISIAAVSDSVSLHFLIRIEETLAKLKSFLSIFKLNAVQALIILAILYSFGFLRYPAEKSRRLFSLFEKYQVFIRRLYIVLVLLCSFTFFGTQLGQPDQHLKLRIKTVRDGYATLYDEVHEAISEQVAIQTFPKVQGNFPEPYQEALQLPCRIEQEVNSLRDYYGPVFRDFGVRNLGVEKLIDEGLLRSQSASDLTIEVPNTPWTKTEVPISDFEHVNYTDIKYARDAVHQFQAKNLHTRFIELMRIEGGKKIICQIPKTFTGGVNKLLFRNIVKEYPILEPFIDVFFRTLDQEIETKVDQELDRIVNSTIQDPEAFNNVAMSTASTIVASENLKITDADVEAARMASEQMSGKIADVIAARDNLFRSVAPKDINVKINPNLSVDIEWTPVPEAESYRVYSSLVLESALDRRSSEETGNTYVSYWLEGNEYPKYFRVSAIKGSLESVPSIPKGAVLIPDEGGTKCQICGAKAIGYCSMRRIYVCEEHHSFTSSTGQGWICP